MRRSFGYLTKEGFRNLWANRLMSFASVAVLLSCMIMIGSAFMLLVNIQSVIDNIEDKNVIMVYVVQDADESAVTQLGDELEALKNVSHVEFVDKETAFKQELENLGTDATYFPLISDLSERGYHRIAYARFTVHYFKHNPYYHVQPQT